MLKVDFGTFGRIARDVWSSSRGYLTRFRDTADEAESELKALLSAPGEVAGIVLAQDILQRYQDAADEEKRRFLHGLAEDFAADAAEIIGASQRYLDEPSARHYRLLMQTSEPPRQEVLRRLNTAPGGTLALVRMREDLLRFLSEEKSELLAALDFDFNHLFSSWFNRGFLSVARIDWNSPAELLERIIRYEAVHDIADWDDLRQRVNAPDRACYAFFHPVLGEEPLIFVEIALTKTAPNSVQALLATGREIIRPQEAKTAVFYSISNCQPGLKGISFGAFLIKQVLQELSQTYPNLTTWVTLSPVPSFTRWLAADDALEETGEGGTAAVSARALYGNLEPLLAAPLEKRGEALKTYDRDLETLALRYFTGAKNRSGAPFDPVARFHLTNGAKLRYIHPRADLSDKGLKESLGLMVNYQYEPRKMLEHHEAYATEQRVVLARELAKRL